MLASQSFITSVVVGKDIVPRIGLHQLEMLRHQLVETLHSSKTAKVTRTLYQSLERRIQLTSVDQLLQRVTPKKLVLFFPDKILLVYLLLTLFVCT